MNMKPGQSYIAPRKQSFNMSPAYIAPRKQSFDIFSERTRKQSFDVSTEISSPEVKKEKHKRH